ncbi:MAG: hypothetical protein H6633_19265 [Anaerolineales bacterium]|nr:hypothetical protein [Anaerolineales bacterium]
MFRIKLNPKKFVLPGAVLVLVIILAACAPAATPAPLATYTPLPTYTPYPTPEPLPTLEPLPTYTPPPTAEAASPTEEAAASPSGTSCEGVPVISSFTANPTTIQVGESASLEWGLVSNAQAAELVSPDGRLGVPTPGQTTVQPNHTTTYSLYAICGQVVVQQQVTVEVEAPTDCEGVPSIETFTANPTTIKAGETSTLEWGAVTNAKAAVLLSVEGKVGVPTPGDMVVEPSQTTTYALVAFCGTDVVQKNVTVEVTDTESCDGQPVISSFTADPPTIKAGESSKLEWGLVANARGAYLTDGTSITGVATPGDETVTPTETTTYKLVAFCGANIVRSNITVTVE